MSAKETATARILAEWRDKFGTLERITRPPWQQAMPGLCTQACSEMHTYETGCCLEPHPARAEDCERSPDGAEQLTEREAEEEVAEPRVECPVGGDCPPDCDRTPAGCVNIWGSDAEYTEASERNANEPCRPGCVNAGWAHIHAGTDDDEWRKAEAEQKVWEMERRARELAEMYDHTEPALSNDELVGVRELLERFGLADVPAPSAAGTSPPEVSGHSPAPPSGGRSHYDQIGGSGPW